MLKQSIVVTALIAVMTSPSLSAQDSPVTQSLKGVYELTKAVITLTAEILDGELYAFQPTEEVRTAGQILAHVANANLMFCSMAAGENSENLEQTRTTKTEIVAALEEAFAYCDGVYANTTDAAGAQEASLFGGPTTVFGILAMNSAHSYEHYGNLVTYMRINGIVPPSSR